MQKLDCTAPSYVTQICNFGASSHNLIHSARFYRHWLLSKSSLTSHHYLPCCSQRKYLLHHQDKPPTYDAEGRKPHNDSSSIAATETMVDRDGFDCENCEKCKLERLLRDMEHSPTCQRSTHLETETTPTQSSAAPKSHVHIKDVCACGQILYVVVEKSLPFLRLIFSPLFPPSKVIVSDFQKQSVAVKYFLTSPIL